MNGSDREPEGLGELTVPVYDPPRVERVLTPAELEREILYAGVDLPSDP